MRKSIFRGVVFFLLFTSSLLGQSQEPYDLYLQATQEQDPEKKVQLLKEYLSKYGGQSTQYEKYVYADLSSLASHNANYSLAVDYGEKALSFTSVNDSTRAQLYLILADSYVKLKQNVHKANTYAEIAIELAQSNLKRELPPQLLKQWTQLLGGAHYVQAAVLKFSNMHAEAVAHLIKAYQILHNEQILSELKQEGKLAYQNTQYQEAEEAFSLLASHLGDQESLYYYGKTLYHNGKSKEALPYFQQVYRTSRRAEIAYNIGIIMAQDETTLDEALNYLAEAVVLDEEKIGDGARNLLEQLYYTRKQGTEKGLQRLLAEARLRIKSSK